MQTALDRLLRAMSRGTTLAALSVVGCGGETDSVDPATSSGGSSASGGTSTSGGGSTASGGSGGSDPIDAGVSLPPYPLEQLGCSGPSFDGGYAGQCCVSPHCYTPTPGSACEAVGSGLRNLLDQFPPGSGRCACGEHQGPFASRADYEAVTPGTCCYLIGSISCEGRPFTVNDVALVAGLALRSDWNCRLA